MLFAFLKILEGEAQYNRVREYTMMSDEGTPTVIDPLTSKEFPAEYPCTDAPALWEFMRVHFPRVSLSAKI